MNDNIDMSEYGIYLHCANCGAETKVHTILDGDSLCKTCLERNQEERMQKGQKEIILVEIRGTVKEILKKLNQQ
jgi:hypothetical protein